MGIFILALVPVNLEYRGPTLYEVIHPPPPQYDLTVTRKAKLLHRPELFRKSPNKIIFKTINEGKTWNQDAGDTNSAGNELNHMSVLTSNFLLYLVKKIKMN